VKSGLFEPFSHFFLDSQVIYWEHNNASIVRRCLRPWKQDDRITSRWCSSDANAWLENQCEMVWSHGVTSSRKVGKVCRRKACLSWIGMISLSWLFLGRESWLVESSLLFVPRLGSVISFQDSIIWVLAGSRQPTYLPVCLLHSCGTWSRDLAGRWRVCCYLWTMLNDYTMFNARMAQLSVLQRQCAWLARFSRSVDGKLTSHIRVL